MRNRLGSTLILFCALTNHSNIYHAVAFANSITAYRANSSADAQRKARPAVETPVTLESGLTQPDHVAVDQTHVYWVMKEHILCVIYKKGGSPTTLFETSGEDTIKAVATDDTSVYVLTSNRLMKVDPDTHDSSELAKTQSNDRQLVIDGTSAYWIGRLEGGTGYQLIKIDKKGGTPTALASGILAPQAGGLAVDGVSAYWSDYADDTLKSVPKESGTPTTVRKLSGPQAVAVDERYIYCVSSIGSIVKLDKTDGARQTLIPKGLDSVLCIVSDRDYLYYAVNDQIMKIAKSGGNPATVARQLEGSYRFAIDECCVYWSLFKTGRVMKGQK